MKNLVGALCAAVGVSAVSLAVAAHGLVAVVESVKGDVPGIEFMDYVSTGQVIKLGPKDSIVLGYLKSCLQETITGGTVIVLEDQSLVQLGTVKRSTVPCDAGHMKLKPREAKESAGNVFRSGPADPASAPAPVPLNLYGQSPVIEVNDRRDPLIIERLDKAGERMEIEIKDNTLLRNRFVDLHKTGTRLARGARYSASQGTAKIEFTIDADAQPGATPIIGRLLSFD